MSAPSHKIEIWNFRAMRFVSWLFVIGTVAAAAISLFSGAGAAAVCVHAFSAWLFLQSHIHVVRATRVWERWITRNGRRHIAPHA